MEIRKLNTLRGVAALMVIVSHYSNRTDLFDELFGEGSGQLGVMLFFILSGFLMSYLYLNKKFDKESIKNFIVARAARVLPLFFLVVIISYAVQQLRGVAFMFAINNKEILISHLLLVGPGVDSLWTIPVEIHFYILFIALWGLHFWRPLYAYIGMALLFISVLVLNFPIYRWISLGLPFAFDLMAYLPYFLIGVIFGQIYRVWKAPSYLRKNIFLLAFLLITFLVPEIFQFFMGYQHKLWQDLGVLVIISSAFFCLIFLVPDNNIILSNRVGDFIGKISYSIYLFHIPILNGIAGPAKKQPEVFLFVFIELVIILAWLSYVFFENPANKAIRAVFSGKRKDV